MESKKVAIAIRMPPKLNNKLAKRVAEIGISKAAFILNLVYEALEGKAESDKLKAEKESK